MESIRPLLEQVPSELIVVDTVGPEKTDGSINIVKEYADKIVFFEWCNDFSAARNAGLKEAKGEWLLYLDDDEWFEDVEELVAFFNSGEEKRYNSLYYKQRNYSGLQSEGYADAHVLRVVRRYHGIRFERSIHEAIQFIATPSKLTNCYVHHYGYAFSDRATFERHIARNMTLLLEEHARQPHDLNIGVHLVQEYMRSEQFENARELIKNLLITNDQNKSPHRLTGWLSSQAVASYAKAGAFTEVIREAEAQLSVALIRQLPRAQICLHVVRASLATGEFQKVLEYGKLYFDNVDYMDLHPQSLVEQDCLILSACLQIKHRNSVLAAVLYACVKLNKLHESIPYVERVFLKDKQFDVEQAMPALCQLIGHSIEFASREKIIKKVVANERLFNQLVVHIQELKDTDPQVSHDLEMFISNLPINHPYVIMQRSLLAEKNQNIIALQQSLIAYEQSSFNDNNPYCYEMLLLLYRVEMTCSSLIDGMSFDMLQLCLRFSLAKETINRIGFLSYLVEQVKGQYNRKSLLLARAYWNEVLLTQNYEEVEFLEAFYQWCDTNWAYYEYTLHPHLFTESGIKDLDGEALLAYYLAPIPEFGRQERYSSIITTIRGVISYSGNLLPVLERFIHILETRLQEQQQKTVQVNKEMEALATQVKATVKQLITSGDMVNAELLIAQLGEIIPYDPDLNELKCQIHQPH